ncbi:hypothetical protein NliqN6_6560 [Naganishia liquefaciens]|uniref:DUF1308 domain-containing protein n=1 Tax=Naganishia liquefaciens TaxID=104408 RepID=A0A8H3YI90_9TREE|nr:hypothetical protein NliqN6_6560 [Naganishia liquefaciens]
MPIHTGPAGPSAHERLCESHSRLAAICRSIRDFAPADHVYQPPILDSHETRYTPQELSGLAKFRATCEREAEWLEELTLASQPPDHPSTNAPYLISVWDQVVTCPRPLISIGEAFKSPRGDKVKVDVVGKGGMLWIKVNTIRMARLLLEFREQDSYINSDYDSSDAEDPVLQAQRAAYPITPINSITKQCYDLVQAATQHRTPWGQVPTVLLRLTRLDGHEAGDPRIQETYQCLGRMGVHVEFGEIQNRGSSSSERPASIPQPLPVPRPHLVATPKLNLDLSLLIALISDISHAPLPHDDLDAESRFKPIDKAWKRQVNPSTGQVTVKRLQDGELGPEEHSRALTYQLKQEMRLGLVEELNQKIHEGCRALGVPVESVEFWTTAEARRRCRDIVAKIGGEQERRREKRLFAAEEGNRDASAAAAAAAAAAGENDFWQGSRHAGAGQPLNRFLSVRILPEDDSSSSPSYLDGTPIAANTFRGRLTETCHRLLSVPMEKGASVTADFLGLSIADSPVSSDVEGSTTAAAARAKAKASAPHRGGQRRRAAPLADTYLRVPTAHTVRSMLEGAKRGMTTVTANRMSVKQMLRAMGPLEALEEDERVVNPSYTPTTPVSEALFIVVEPKTLGELKRSDLTDVAFETERRGSCLEQAQGDNLGGGSVDAQPAEFWVLEPRSLGEDPRGDKADA